MRVHPGRYFRRGAAVAAASTLAVTMSACSSTSADSPSAQPTTASTATESGTDEWDQIVAAAAEEGELVISVHAGSGFEEWGQRMADVFPDLDVQVTSIGPSDSVPRILAEQANGQFLWDLIIGPNSAVHNGLAPAGALADMRPILAGIPEDVRQDEDWAGGFELYGEPDQGTSFINQINMTGGVWINTDLAGDIETPEDLLDPKYKGKIVAEDLRTPQGSTQIVSAMLKEYGEEYVAALLDQDIQRVDNKQVALEWIADGRAAVAIGPTADIIAEYQELGLGQNIERRKIGFYGLAQSVNVLKNAPHPNAVRVFLHYFLSQEGQSLWAEISRADASSRRTDVPVFNEFATDYSQITEDTLLQGTDREGDLMDRTLALTNR